MVAQPPGPGLPRQAPSVISCTRFIIIYHMGVADTPQEKSATPERPLVLIPVTAEDVARRKHRIILLCVAVALILTAIGAWLYKRTMDPMHAVESYDAGVRLLKIARYSQAILSFDRAIALQPDMADAYLLRGRARLGEVQPERAIADFSKAIELR